LDGRKSDRRKKEEWPKSQVGSTSAEANWRDKALQRESGNFGEKKRSPDFLRSVENAAIGESIAHGVRKA
jgi:hypothetical protein